MTILGILAFVVALLLSVMLHEAGHFFMARRFGMKVTEFFVGFGPKLWSHQRGEVEFGFKAIPAGGYVRIVGMTPSEALTPEDAPRAFYKARIRHRIITLAAGSIVHILLGYILILILLIGIGVGTYTPLLSSVGECVPQPTATICSANDPLSPAKLVGMRVGDRILSINGAPVEDWIEGTGIIRANAGRPLNFVIVRDAIRMTVEITPAARIGSDGKTSGYVGIGPSYEYLRSSPWGAILDGALVVWRMATGSLVGLISMPGKIPALWNQTVHGAPRDSSGLVGVVGVARVSGEAFNSQRIDWREKSGLFISIIAGLNIFVGLFNALPLPPLDGGHIAVAIADRLRAWWSARRGRPRPEAIDVARLTPVTLVVLGLLVTLSLLLLAADLVNPVRLNL